MRKPTKNDRNEIKYYVEPALVPEIINYSKAHIEHDQYAKKMPDYRYIVRSLYYDSPRLDFYWEKIDGLKVRRKLRIRTYNYETPESIAFLEIKRRYGSAVVKERAKYPYVDVRELLSSPENIWLTYQQSNNGSLVLGKWVDNIIRWKLEPTMLIVYSREAYVGRYEDENNCRLTVDYNVSARVSESLDNIYSDEDLIPVTGNTCILELKYNHFMPKWMRGLVQEMRLTQRSISKYCMGVDESILKN